MKKYFAVCNTRNKIDKYTQYLTPVRPIAPYSKQQLN